MRIREEIREEKQAKYRRTSTERTWNRGYRVVERYICGAKGHIARNCSQMYKKEDLNKDSFKYVVRLPLMNKSHYNL